MAYRVEQIEASVAALLADRHRPVPIQVPTRVWLAPTITAVAAVVVAGITAFVVLVGGG
jgi:hypothetical protein